MTRRPVRLWAVALAVTCTLAALPLVPERAQGAFSATSTGTGAFTAGTFDSVNSYPGNILNSNPMAYWRLDETSGTVAADSGGTGYTGTYVGGPTLGQPGALPQQTRTSVQLTGSQLVTVADVGSMFDFPARQQYSVEFWIRPAKRASGTEQWERVVAKQTDSGGIKGWAVNLHRTANDASLTIEFERVWSQPLQTTRQVPADQWSHVAAVYDGTDMIVYVNGTEAGRKASADNQQDWPGPLTIGARQAGSDHLVGRLDEVTVYFYPLTAVQVAGHANATG